MTSNKKIKVIYYFVLLVISNYLIMTYAYHPGSIRYITLIALFIGIFSIFLFSKHLTGMFTSNTLSIIEMQSGRRKFDPEEKKFIKYFIISLFTVIALQVATIFIFVDKQKNALMNKGVETKAVVFGKVLKQYKGKQYYHIYYDFEIGNQRFTFNERNNNFNVGDTISIRYLPENPNNHMIITGQ